MTRTEKKISILQKNFYKILSEYIKMIEVIEHLPDGDPQLDELNSQKADMFSQLKHITVKIENLKN